MIKIYLDRNVDVKNLKKEINYKILQEKIEFIQWPLKISSFSDGVKNIKERQSVCI